MNSNELQDDSDINDENQSVDLFNTDPDKYTEDRLGKIYRETFIERWEKALINMQTEIGSDKFKDFTQKLFIWGAKHELNSHFFKALAKMHPGLSLEMQIDKQNLEQVSFACTQTFYDLDFCRYKISQLDQSIDAINKRREHDFDIMLDVYLDEDCELRQKWMDNLKRIETLNDELWELLYSKGLIDDGDYPWEWLSKSK